MLSLKNIVPLLLSVIFLSAGGFYHIRHQSNFTVSSVSSEVISNLREEFEQVEKEANQLLKSTMYDKAWQSLQHSFLLIDSTGVIAWSKHEFLPDLRLLQEPFKYKLLQLSRGNFLIRKWKINKDTFLLCIISLNDRYKVSNQYLKEKWNHAIFPIDGIEILNASDALGSKICLDERTCLFTIRLNLHADNYPDDWTSIFLIIVGLILLLVSLFNLLLIVHQKGYYDLVFIATVIFLCLIRISLMKVGFPIQWGQLELFDPQKFASSSFNVSLGDFAANSMVVAICCTYLILNYSKFKCIKWIDKSSGVIRFIFGCISLLIAFFSFLFPFLFFELVSHNSGISLDITNQVHFDASRVISFLAIVLGTISSFFFCHVFIRIAISTSNNKRIRFLSMLLIAVLFFMLYCLVENHDYTITLVIAVLYILVIYLSGLHHSLHEISFTTYLYLLVTIIAYGGQGALSIRIFNKEARFAAQFRFANSNLINQDNLGEYLLSENIKRIEQDAFIQLRLTNPFLPKEAIRQRINQRYLSSYFDRYESKIYLYNATGAAVNNLPTSDLFSTIGNIHAKAMKTDYESVYLIRDQVLKSTRHYAGIVPIKRSNVLVGYVVLDLSLKRIVPQNVFPELLVDNRFSQFLGSKDFSFAIYTLDSISNSFGNFNYERNFDPKLLESPALFSDGIIEYGLQHIAVKGDSNEVAVVSANSYPLFYVVVNFAFLTIFGLSILLIWIIGYAIHSFLKGSRLKYSARIQLYVYLAFILPLIIVMVSTLGLTSKANETKLLEDAQLKAELTGEGVVGLMNTTLIDTLSLDNTLEINLKELSKFNNVDINVFNSNGLLMASSQPTIYENQLSSIIMNRPAFQQVVYEKDSYVVEKENIGTLQYNSSYYAIKSPVTGKLHAILNIPFFKSADAFEEIQALVLGNILVIFVCVFILFSVLSFYAVNWLTFPLRLITKRLSKTTLTGKNQPLLWEAQDEIGLMVKEYNHMLANFEHSKAELARSQKESAWREMAQQVAHEIKNPLTPMKLTLQQMEQTVRDDEKKYQAVKMLLTQVDILNDIASSFSTFAKMPSPQLIRLNLVQVLKSTIHLYANHSAGKVSLMDNVDEVFVLGDEQLLNRVFSNLILNALQSGEDSKKIIVEVRLIVTDHKCRIIIKDDGRGMDANDHERIFMPYFSTKKIGSGLGLAIAKQGIEQCGGSISFESELGKGTSFWIELKEVL